MAAVSLKKVVYMFQSSLSTERLANLRRIPCMFVMDTLFCCPVKFVVHNPRLHLNHPRSFLVYYYFSDVF